VVFKRRDPRSWARTVFEFFFPRGGWRRASSYIYHRLRRLPDSPERIARGVFAGTLASFMPFFGFHFLTAALIGWVIRANILASLIATFVGNPFTFPIFAGAALAMGGWILGIEVDMTVQEVMTDVGRAFMQLWKNFTALLTGGEMHWSSLQKFFWHVFAPYTIGGILPGIATGLVLYYVSLPIIRRYQRRRANKAAERNARRIETQLRAIAEAQAADFADLGLDLDDDADMARRPGFAEAARGMSKAVGKTMDKTRDVTKAVGKALPKSPGNRGDGVL
jgi:uncharacterized protein (DUF2062 family)